MTTPSTATPNQHEPQLLGQTVVLIGGSAGIGLETALHLPNTSSVRSNA